MGVPVPSPSGGSEAGGSGLFSLGRPLRNPSVIPAEAGNPVRSNLEARQMLGVGRISDPPLPTYAKVSWGGKVRMGVRSLLPWGEGEDGGIEARPTDLFRASQGAGDGCARRSKAPVGAGATSPAIGPPRGRWTARAPLAPAAATTYVPVAHHYSPTTTARRSMPPMRPRRTSGAWAIRPAAGYRAGGPSGRRPLPGQLVPTAVRQRNSRRRPLHFHRKPHAPNDPRAPAASPPTGPNRQIPARRSPPHAASIRRTAHGRPYI